MSFALQHDFMLYHAFHYMQRIIIFLTSRTGKKITLFDKAIKWIFILTDKTKAGPSLQA